MSEVRDGFARGLTHAVTLVISLMALLALIGIIVFALAFGLGAGMASVGTSAADATGYVHVLGKRASKNRLLTVRVQGPILGTPPKDRATQLFSAGYTYGYEVQHQLEAAADDKNIKGILLHLQTPGGTIFGSRAIHDGVVAYRKKADRPVVVYIEGLSASGGVMAMVGANAIYADHGSLIGSIGVLGPQLLYFNKPLATDGGLLESGIVTQNGIEQTIVSAGRGKDLGNPFRRATDEELSTLRRGVEAEYAQFVQHVATHRKIDPGVIRDQMGAMIFDNTTAQDYGLIDGTASRAESVQKLATLAGLGEDYSLVRPVDEDGSVVRRLLASSLQSKTAEPSLSSLDLARIELCASARTPLAYYGDLRAWCEASR